MAPPVSPDLKACVSGATSDPLPLVGARCPVVEIVAHHLCDPAKAKAIATTACRMQPRPIST